MKNWLKADGGTTSFMGHALNARAMATLVLFLYLVGNPCGAGGEELLPDPGEGRQATGKVTTLESLFPLSIPASFLNEDSRWSAVFRTTTASGEVERYWLVVDWGGGVWGERERARIPASEVGELTELSRSLATVSRQSTTSEQCPALRRLVRRFTRLRASYVPAALLTIDSPSYAFRVETLANSASVSTNSRNPPLEKWWRRLEEAFDDCVE